MASSASLAVDESQRCQQAKNKIAGNYALCLQKADGAYVLDGDASRRVVALSRCAITLEQGWNRVQDRFNSCTSRTDLGPIRNVIDHHSEDLALALTGLPPGTCVGDLASCTANLSTCRGANLQGRLVKTGVTTCSNAAGAPIGCAGSGQDGQLQKGLTPALVDAGDGTITDLTTALVWEKLSDDGSIHDVDDTYTWREAATDKLAALNTMQFAGFRDWRLPNRAELESLNDWGRSPMIWSVFDTNCVPGCSVSHCSCTKDAFYWSSSTDRFDPDDAWVVQGGAFSSNKFNGHFVRAVRGGR